VPSPLTKQKREEFAPKNAENLKEISSLTSTVERLKKTGLTTLFKEEIPSLRGRFKEYREGRSWSPPALYLDK
jgi:hypothetical protein